MNKKNNYISYFSNTSVLGLFFVIIIASLSHLLFSHLGYNPTDDGFTLAYSRRILDGQIPHLDFIIIRPFLSPLLHLPVVAFGGDYTFYISRFIVWIQFALIAFLLTNFIVQSISISINIYLKLLFPLITFIIAAHTFPIMAWHTIDGLMLSVIGLNLLISHSKFKKNTGFLILGLAYLCKQSFLPLGFIVILFDGEWRKIERWVSFLSPALIYFLVLILYDTNAFENAILQITSQTGLSSIINFQFETIWLPAGIILGLIIWLSLDLAKNMIDILSYIFFSSILSLIVFGSMTDIVNKISLLLSGIFISLMIINFKQFRNFNSQPYKTYFIFSILTICVSISFGYNYPVFVTGGFILLFYSYVAQKGFRFNDSKWIMIIVTVLLLGSFIYSRYNFIYREAPFTEINYELGGVLSGASLIKTNVNTFNVLSDLHNITKSISAKNKKYAIVPDNAGYWVKAQQQNPLSIDWVFETELNKEFLKNRIKDDLNRNRGSLLIILQKYDAEYIAKEYYSVILSNSIVKYVQSNFNLLFETKYYYVYQ